MGVAPSGLCVPVCVGHGLLTNYLCGGSERPWEASILTHVSHPSMTDTSPSTTKGHATNERPMP